MTRWGIGPRWALACVVLCVPLLVVGRLWPGAFAIPAPRLVLVLAGCALLAIGVPFCVSAMAVLHRGFPEGKLFTRGAYSLCRHPIYASWVVFLVPAIALLGGTWLLLLAPPLMAALLLRMVRAEEQWLEGKFGDEYRAYRRRVRAILPWPRRG